MNLDPFDELTKMHEEIDRLFSRLFRTRPLLGRSEGKELAKYEGFRTPAVDVRETENSVIAAIELPVADKKDIDLNVTENKIEISVKKKTEKELKKKGFYSYEARAHQYYRALPLPTEVIADKADAIYKDGILRIEIPKVKKAIKKKKIED